MNYGFFDDENREYVVTKPDTPAPWCNYLGSPAYGAIISNNAAGYSFVQSGGKGRLTRFHFNDFMTNLPGRYLYLSECETKDYWSASWQPVAKSLKEYQSICRHGTGYTSITSDYHNVHTETVYYVPLKETYEVWHFTVENQSREEKKLKLFAFTELTNESDYEQDTVNLQYTQFISKTYFRENHILQSINENVRSTYRFFGAAVKKVDGYDGDREVFIGAYRNYGNPASVEKGACSNSLNYNGNSCGALELMVTLQPGEAKSFDFILGEGDDKRASEIISKYMDHGRVAQELIALKEFWKEKLERFQVKTPDDNFNHSVNVWNAYQCFITFVWSRAASIVYCGLRDGYGFRDTVQDIQGILHLDPELGRERLSLMLSGQTKNGGGMPLVKFTHKQGEMEDEEIEYRSDDALWLFPTVKKYIEETGNLSYLNEVIPYADEEGESVYGHLKRAILFSENHLGKHGIPAGLDADWNDCLRLGNGGESAFVAFQLYYALEIYESFARLLKDEENFHWAQKLKETLSVNIQSYLWKGDRFLRGITEEGLEVGAPFSEEANLWLNAQSWAVFSGAANQEQGELALEQVHKQLNTNCGAMLLDPPMKKMGLPVARMTLFNASTKENGGIFSQPQGWLINAEAKLGHGDRAYEYYLKCNPASYNDCAEVRKIEPYVHGQFIEGSYSPFEGRAHVSWLTGTASTVMIGLLEGILGVHPQLDGIVIDPCIPSCWKEFSMKKVFRNKILQITVKNPGGIQKGIEKVIVNQKEISGPLILLDELTDYNEITIFMG